MFVSDTGLFFSFFVASLSGFGIRVMETFSSSAIFWKGLSRILLVFKKQSSLVLLLF